MHNYDLRYGEDRYGVAAAAPSARAVFVRRVYGHLSAAVLGFVLIETLLFQTGLALPFLKALTSFGMVGMLALVAAFIASGYVAQHLAQSATSDAARYAGLALYVAVEAVIFLPLLAFAEARYPGENLPLQAGIVTLLAFAGLTAATVASGKNFSFLGPILGVLSFAALGVVLAAIFLGFNLGLVFSAAMIVLAAGYIVYDTSNIMHVYREDQYVAAALHLFASVALMFYYVLRVMMSFGNSDD